ncbi:hypothetical protein HGM15179_014717 [Zosterops borbonicus]|uniref:Uncharacterized protein n=1 Tax=Zosterops borbonicus TaxID=364589 RepID=A0A8K1G5R0_9PASS|nr:hypothetical protein HGM15179_014717 [Zosterops borbonicus]
MDDYRNLMIKGIKESVPCSNNSKLAFDNVQGKDETPVPILLSIHLRTVGREAVIEDRAHWSAGLDLGEAKQPEAVRFFLSEIHDMFFLAVPKGRNSFEFVAAASSENQFRIVHLTLPLTCGFQGASWCSGYSQEKILQHLLFKPGIPSLNEEANPAKEGDEEVWDYGDSGHQKLGKTQVQEAVPNFGQSDWMRTVAIFHGKRTYFPSVLESVPVTMECQDKGVWLSTDTRQG